MNTVRIVVTLGLLAVGIEPAHAQSLRGSPASLDIQNRVAVEHDFTYIETPEQVYRFERAGYLVKVPGNADYRLHDVSFPYARPESRLFIERLASQYRASCGEQLVVTSLTRPRNRQPPNASARSVHPTGMAVDFRVSNDARCRAWIERVFLQLEAQGVIDATREYNPPHYHIAVFPTQYRQYVARITASEPRLAYAPVEHRVSPGDTLWDIARQHSSTIAAIQQANNLASATIRPGQVLTIPAIR